MIGVIWNALAEKTTLSGRVSCSARECTRTKKPAAGTFTKQSHKERNRHHDNKKSASKYASNRTQARGKSATESRCGIHSSGEGRSSSSSAARPTTASGRAAG